MLYVYTNHSSKSAAPSKQPYVDLWCGALTEANELISQPASHLSYRDSSDSYTTNYHKAETVYNMNLFHNNLSSCDHYYGFETLG